jgi:hypothetical protein
VLTILAVALLAAAQFFGVLLPVDEAASQPDFFTFRAHLQTAIAKRDVQAVLDVLDPNIKNSFGGDGGIAEFKEMWRINEPDSELWAELGTVLALGGTFGSADSFTAPYTFSKWPDQFDAFEHLAVIGTNVRVRSAPNLTASVIATASHAIVQSDPAAPQADGWESIKLKDGRKGYIGSQFVRSPIDYRAYFSKSGGRWRLITFVAGD